MTIIERIEVAVGKFVANLVSAMFFNKEHRHKVRYMLNPQNPERCVNYLEKHYTQIPAIPVAESTKMNCPIWVCWLQGLDQAPQLVQNCIRSIERNKQEGQQVIILTAKNFNEYIDLPAVMIDKWEKGQITNTHLSDLIRIHVLARHGGCWIDATIYQTAPIPLQIAQSPLFLFHTHGEFSYTFIQSCFMVSEPNNYVMRKWCAAMHAYWTMETRLINYFTLHLMFIALLHQDSQFKAEFEKVMVLSDEPMHILLYEMMKGGDYSEQLMDKAKNATFVQKLTYKFPPSLLENKHSIASHFSQKDTMM